MDVKAVSWVGDMYQKFEAMCVEVEETMYQDTVTYVESQVKTVGACVKRFYSDVMQDLIPLSSDDLVKPESPSSHTVNYATDVNHDMSEEKIMKEPIKASTEKLRKDRLSAKCCNVTNTCELPFEDSSGVKCPDLHVDQSDSEHLNLGDEDKSEAKLLPSEILALKTCLKGGACEAREGKICEEIDDMDKCVASTSIISSSSRPTALDELGNDQNMLKELDGTSYETIQDEIESDHADKEAVQIFEHGKMKIDESCVLVDRYEPFSLPHIEGRQRSYKKKIKDVFYPRSWSRSKSQAHEQLPLQHRDMESRSNHGSRTTMVPAPPPGPDNTILQGNEPFESGWEIL